MMIGKFRDALLAGLLACLASPAAAEDIADFYKGKTVTVIVGYPPASGYTFYGQVLARAFADHIPGKPTVIVQNMPGAGSIKAANYLYNVAPKDGTAVGIFSVGALIDELFGHSTTSFDTTKFGWVGNMDETIGLCVVNGNSGIASFDDLRKKGDFVRRYRPFGRRHASRARTHALYGAKIKLIKGYPGAEDVVLAMDRGEVQGVCGLTKTVLKSRFAESLKSGQLKPIIHDNMKSQADLPGVPGVYDFAKTAKDREVLDLLFGWRVLGRPVAAPPGVPPERLQALQQAFLDTMKDPRFVAEAQKASLDLAPSSGEEVAALIKRLFSKDTVARAAEAVRNN